MNIKKHITTQHTYRPDKSPRQNPKRIAKNSLFLYFRLIITMGISLYTSRVVLNALGVEDYGVYNVVGGFVAIFTSLTNSLNISFSRFMTIAIAKDDIGEQKKVFTATINMLLLASLIFILLSEIIGLWYFPYIINVPINRHPIVNQLFHLSLFAFIVSLGKIPCISLIIAHEKSNAYAFLGILDALVKLTCVCVLAETDGDKLIGYCLLLLVIDFLSLLYTSLYCKYQFKCFSYVKNVPKHVYKEMFNFASWSFSGLTARVVNAQGLTLIINIYLGVAVNAAIGIISQIDGCTRQFINNIGIAVDPQIIKSYATGNISYMRKLSLFSSKCFAIVVLLYAIPISVKADYILQIWLGFVPEYVSNLLRLVFCSTLFQVMANPLEIIANATGVISRFQFVTSIIYIVTLPIIWLLLIFGFNVYNIYTVVVLSYIAMLIVKFYLTKEIINASSLGFFKNQILRIFVTAIMSSSILYIVSSHINDSLWGLAITIILSFATTTFFAFTIGFSKQETSMVISLIKLLINNKLNNKLNKQKV